MKVEFTSSDSFREADDGAAESASVEAAGYLEATYETLRVGPDGEEIAHLSHGAWQLPDGRRFSDWAIELNR